MLNAAKKILPQDPTAAVEKLIDITRDLYEVMEGEANAIAMRDEVRMLDTSARKDVLLPQYQAAAREFKDRVEEFRSVDRVLLNQLEDQQSLLGQITNDNQQWLTVQ